MTWESTGKGEKRKKTDVSMEDSKKKIHKRQKTDVSMESIKESMKNSESKDSVTDKVSFEFGEVKAITNNMHEIAYENCKKTVGDGKQKARTKVGCVATQQTPSFCNGNSKVCCSCVQAHRGGEDDDGDGDGDGGDGDDGEGKPSKKPLEVVSCSNAGKQKPKKKKSCSEMDVDHVSSSAMDVSCESTVTENTSDVEVISDQQQENTPHVQPQFTQEFVEKLGKLPGYVNHYDFCGTRPCLTCHTVETTLIQHHFNETNGTCRCPNCKLWLCVLKYHTATCIFEHCIICKKAKGIPSPAPAAPVIFHQTPSLDPNDLIVWRDKCVPEDITHFKEDHHYMLKDSIIGKGGHGAVQDMIMSDDVKKNMFNSDCIDFVMKKTKEVGEDEKCLFEETAKHPNFVQTFLLFKKTHPTPQHCIVMEKCEMTLKDHLRKLAGSGKRLEIYQAMFYWTQTLDALKHLHNLRIPMIHKDIKAENVLLSIRDNLVRVKLADYDTVKKLDNDYTQPGLVTKGTLGLISPEVLTRQSHGRPADIWNMAMFLLQLLFVVDFTKLQKDLKDLQQMRMKTKDFVNKDLKDLQQMRMKTKDFVNAKIAELKEMDNELADLIRLCLSEDPSKRPTATQILKDPAVAEYIKREINMDELIRQIRPDLEVPKL